MRRRAVLLGVALMCCNGCTTTRFVSLGEGILLTATSSEFQMLKPARSHRTCTTRRGWGGQSEEVEALGAVVTAMLADTPDADGLAGLRVTSTIRDFLVARRECLEVSADAVRAIRVISLPASGHAH